MRIDDDNTAVTVTAAAAAAAAADDDDVHCRTTIVNHLTALGGDQLSWREWLSTHLMPHDVVVQLPDGQVEVRQRVLSDSPLAPAESSTADKVSCILEECERGRMHEEWGTCIDGMQ